jgi:membrane protein DedA with SNARE-associated domain
MARAELFFRRYGSFSVGVCRFIPVLRSTVPLVAGMSGMAVSRFVLANVCSAVIWAPAHVLPAQFAGKTLSRLEGGDWKGAALLGAGTLAAAALGVGLHFVLRRRVPVP